MGGTASSATGGDGARHRRRASELPQRTLRTRREYHKPLPVIYRGVGIDCGYRIDLLVANSAIVELKAVERLLRVHEAQLLTYLRVSGHHIGFLLNFNVPLMKDGIKRMVHPFSKQE